MYSVTRVRRQKTAFRLNRRLIDVVGDVAVAVAIDTPPGRRMPSASQFGVGRRRRTEEAGRDRRARSFRPPPGLAGSRPSSVPLEQRLDRSDDIRPACHSARSRPVSIASRTARRDQSQPDDLLLDDRRARIVRHKSIRVGLFAVMLASHRRANRAAATPVKVAEVGVQLAVGAGYVLRLRVMRSTGGGARHGRTRQSSQSL